jgi:hypothetical protein
VVGQGARSVAVATAGIMATAYRERGAGANDAVAMTRLSRWDDRARLVALRVERCALPHCHPEAAASSRLKDLAGRSDKEAALAAVRKLVPPKILHAR